MSLNDPSWRYLFMFCVPVNLNLLNSHISIIVLASFFNVAWKPYFHPTSRVGNTQWIYENPVSRYVAANTGTTSCLWCLLTGLWDCVLSDQRRLWNCGIPADQARSTGQGLSCRLALFFNSYVGCGIRHHRKIWAQILDLAVTLQVWREEIARRSRMSGCRGRCWLLWPPSASVWEWTRPTSGEALRFYYFVLATEPACANVFVDPAGL